MPACVGVVISSGRHGYDFRGFGIGHYPRIPGGKPQATAIGGGNLEDIFNAAADHWEHAIRDEHTVLLHFGWSPVGGDYIP